MKYDAQLSELKNLLPAAKNILIALPVASDIDKMAAALSLFLTLEAAGKEVSIVSDDAILVGQSHLFGVDHIQKNLPQTDGGNLTLTLEGVAALDGTVPALQKLDWYAEGNNLNLVFHVLPGQTFQPAKIVPKYQGSSFSVVFTIGAVNLNALGNVYLKNQSVFSGVHIVDIDTQSANSSFGSTNIIDATSASLSEIMTNLTPDLGFSLDTDAASNLLTGIFDATNNLNDSKVTADTYMAVANCLRVGGRKPFDSVQGRPSVGNTPVQNKPAGVSMPQRPAYDWNAVSAAIGQPITPSAPQDSTASVVPPADNNQPSPEERPSGEGVISETVEPDWLTPKIFKGTSLG